MNQDSEQNRSGDSKPRRDGESFQRPGRSFDRRDDGRNDQTPRFNRSRNDRPDGARDRNDNDRRNRNDGGSQPPRFIRDGDTRNNERPNDQRRPRSNRDQTDRPNNYRENRSRDEKPRSDTDRRDGRTDESRPRVNRDNRSGRTDERRPSFERRDDRSGRSNEGPGPERPGLDRSGLDRSRPERTHDRPERPVNRFGNEPPRWTERFPDRTDSDRPRFDRDRSGPRPDREERPRFDRDRNQDSNRNAGSNDRQRRSESSARPTGPSRPDRSDRFSDNNSRRDRPEQGDRPSRFSRDQNQRSDKPSFKRAGGFSREGDERTKSRFSRDDQRDGTPRNDSRDEDRKPAGSADRFSSQQRKESGDRRTGSYSKAPNYNLEQSRYNDSSKSKRPAKPREEREGNSGKIDRSTTNDGTTRLNRYIANSGICSRREADELIARGDISVNGKVVTEMGHKVKEGDTVKYGTKVLNPERFVYVLLNKPKDYITTTEDPEERKTVMELVADAGNFRMYPVGRLDRNTTGLLLMTNDGELADKLTHPSNEIRKIYQVELDKPITDEHFEAIKKGFDLEDGAIKPDALSIVTPDAQVIGIEIHSGRNRIVRRIFEHFGYVVSKLDRTTYAGLTKKELPRGKWRFLDPKEVVKLKYLN